jgi:DNA polymerase-1
MRWSFAGGLASAALFWAWTRRRRACSGGPRISCERCSWGKLIRDAIEAYEGPVVYHNAKFDCHALASAGISHRPGTRIHDTRIMSWLLDPPVRHGLKPLSARFIDPKAAIFEDGLKKGMHKNGWDWATVPVEFIPYWTYAATDPVFTARLAERFWPQINDQGLAEAYAEDMQVQVIAGRLEERGMRIDIGYTERTLALYQARMYALTLEFQKFGIDKPGSNDLISAALKAEGWEPEDWTDTGKAKLTADILKGIDHEIAPLVLEYRKLRKLSGSYLSNFLEMKDGDRLHASINTLAARTGRMSVSEPALQTIPRGTEIRRCFLASEGHSLVSVDFDQIEARLFAAFAREPEMLAAIRGGIDLHTLVAEAVGIPRQAAKAVNFGKLYGAGAEKIAETAGVPVEEAVAFLEMYERRFPGTVTFMDEVSRSVINGRPGVRIAGNRVLPGDKDKEYALTNYTIQGTAAVILKRKMIELDNAGLADYMVMPIHDEFIFDVPKPEAYEFMVEVMGVLNDDSFGVDLTTSGDICDNSWADKYSV